MTQDGPTSIARMSASELATRLPDLALLLHACVHAGASVSFVLPFSEEDGQLFWQTKVLPPMHAGDRLLWVARQHGQVVGSVLLDQGTPPNQRHRAEVSKLLVHPGFRRQGIARLLMAELEREAVRLGRNLLTLDTRTGDMAEPLYASLGYWTAGVIPGYCRDPFSDRLDSTTIMYKVLG